MNKYLSYLKKNKKDCSIFKHLRIFCSGKALGYYDTLRSAYEPGVDALEC